MRTRNWIVLTLFVCFGIGPLAHAAVEPWQEILGGGDSQFSSHSTCFLPYSIDDVHICGAGYAAWRRGYAHHGDPLLMHADWGMSAVAAEPAAAAEAPAAEAAGPGAEWFASSTFDPTYSDRLTCFP